MAHRPRRRAREGAQALATLSSLTRSMTRAASASMDMARTTVAASSVIAHRSRRIHAALSDPGAPHDAELMRMVTEKIAAGVDAPLAAWRAMPALHAAMLRWSEDQARLALGFALALSAARSPDVAVAAQERFVAASAARAAAAGAELTRSWLYLASRAAAPVHRAVRANALRLAPPAAE